MSESIFPQPATVIKVIGVGGAGGNAVSHMASSDMASFEFICANTDAQALSNTKTEKRIQLGEGGLVAGSDPIDGRESELRERAGLVDQAGPAHPKRARPYTITAVGESRRACVGVV